VVEEWVLDAGALMRRHSEQHDGDEHCFDDGDGDGDGDGDEDQNGRWY